MKSDLFSHGSSAGVFHLTKSQTERLPDLAVKAQRELKLLDFSTCQTKQQALKKLGNDLALPKWYGANFDALHDCLSDPDWRPKNGLIVNISGLDSLQRKDPEAFSTLLEVLQASCQSEPSAQDSPLWFLLDTHAPSIKPLPKA
jgi:RNAse (barnase) inhibitor barstar